MSKVPMLRVPAIQQRELNAYVETLLAPLPDDSPELAAAQTAVLARVEDRTLVGTLDEHKAGFKRVIDDAVARVRASASDDGRPAAPKPRRVEVK